MVHADLNIFLSLRRKALPLWLSLKADLIKEKLYSPSAQYHYKIKVQWPVGNSAYKQLPGASSLINKNYFVICAL